MLARSAKHKPKLPLQQGDVLYQRCADQQRIDDQKGQ